MTKQLTALRLISALKKVPEKKLRIVDLVDQVTVNGEINYGLVSEKHKEFNLAEAEARAYIQLTQQAIFVLRKVSAC